jgi:hypothetical protein
VHHWAGMSTPLRSCVGVSEMSMDGYLVRLRVAWIPRQHQESHVVSSQLTPKEPQGVRISTEQNPLARRSFIAQAE